MAPKQQSSLDDVLASMDFKDQIGRRLVLQSIFDLDLDQNQLEGSLTNQQIQKLKQHRQRQRQKSTFSAGRRTIQNIRDKQRIDRDLRLDRQILQVNEEEEGDFAAQIDNGKRFRSYTYYEPPKYKVLGYSKYGMPIFKMSDVFLTSDPIMRSLIDKQFNQIIYGRSATTQKLETGQVSRKTQKNYSFEKIIQTWQKKQYEDFTANKRNQMNEQQLQEIIVNRGDSKDNYWIYKTGQRNKMSWGQIFQGKPLQNHHNKKQIKSDENENENKNCQKLNPYLAHPKFKQNLNKIVSKLRLQYANIQQFQDSNQIEQNNEAQQTQKQKQEQNKQKLENENNNKISQMLEIQPNTNKQYRNTQKQDTEKRKNQEQQQQEEDEQQEDDDQQQQELQEIQQKSGQAQEQQQQYEKYQKLYDDFKKGKNKQQQSLIKKQPTQHKNNNKNQQSQRIQKVQKQVTILDDLDSPYPQPHQQKQQQLNKDYVKYWGQQPILASKLTKNNSTNTKIKYSLVEEQPIQQTQNNNANNSIPQFKNKCQRNIIEEDRALVQDIIKQYSIVNNNLIVDQFRRKQSLENYNRIQFHLQNPQFFLTKLHFALQKKSQQFQNFIQGSSGHHINPLTRNISNPSAINRDRSMISGSLGTGNQGTLRQSNPQNIGIIDQDHQSIQQKILKQMSHHSKKPITHSEVATKLLFIKFSTALQQFAFYHRHQFKYQLYFNRKVKVSLLRHPKPLKNKPSQLNINMEKIDSHKKFNRSEALSLASQELKQYILVEYIQENPLLMSDIGMCERMMIQVNNQQMLQKINNDIINDQQDIDMMEQRRDRQHGQINVSTQRKMELWRENIKKQFGQNGKVYLWQPKRQSKVIGSPQGLGVAMMESNLGVTPVVKKSHKKTDFLLVRQGNRWIIRKIDAIYASGQVQPKQVVYTPDNRHYQSFLENYQRDFIKKFALKNPQHKIVIDEVKKYFPNTPQTSAQSRLRKILKNKMKATSKDNKTYQIPIDQGEISFLIKPQDYCLYERMQKSLCELTECGITQMKNMEKMKSILRKFFKEDINDLRKFATSRMIRDQLQLTSWYLTESFYKFMEKKARIQMYGHADPTNGHGGYSFIKKPQKQRTDKDQSQKKQEKQKLSGTQFDLRKLKAQNSIQFLLSKGYSREEVENKTRWQLVSYIKKQKNTEYARKERQTKEQKQQNQRKQRSRLFNVLLKNLKLDDNYEDGGAIIEPYQYDFNMYNDLQFYMQREKQNWINSKQNYERRLRTQGGVVDDDQMDDDDS